MSEGMGIIYLTPLTTLDRLDSFVDGMADKRLTYKALIQ
jgi:hypothetical protein